MSAMIGFAVVAADLFPFGDRTLTGETNQVWAISHQDHRGCVCA